MVSGITWAIKVSSGGIIGFLDMICPCPSSGVIPKVASEDVRIFLSLRSHTAPSHMGSPDLMLKVQALERIPKVTQEIC